MRRGSFARQGAADPLGGILRKLDLKYPQVDEAGRARLAEARRALLAEG